MNGQPVSSFFQYLPLFKGKMRLARLCHKALISNASDIIIEGHDKIRYKVPNLKETIGEELFINGFYEKEIINLVIKNLNDDQAFLDLGANIGAIALAVAKEKKNNKIFCVEASKRVFDYLSYNIEQNNAFNIVPINRALSDVDDMQLSFYAPVDKFGKGSLSPVFTENTEIIDSITLDTLILKYFITNIGVIKIDVEGHEHTAFKGAEKLLQHKNAPKIVFEFVDWAERQAKGLNPGMAQKLLIDYGYRLFTIEKSKNSFKLIKADKIFYEGCKMFFATK